jgi:hypothetical protein
MTGFVLALAGGSYGTPPPTVIGQSYGGGYYAGQISTAGNGVADYYLVVAPVSSGENASRQFKTTDTATSGTSSVINGPTNSSNMNNASHPAAQFCEGLTIGGFNDWYMPAKNELEVCYYNLKPTTAPNNTSFGANLNAVPARPSNYTSEIPAQTSATIFRTGNAEAFSAFFYWSSTEGQPTEGQVQSFNTGQQAARTKYYSYRVRAVRRIAV